MSRFKLVAGDWLTKWTFSSFKNVAIHVGISFILAMILYLTVTDRASVSNQSFVTIMASMASASGMLLAVTVAVASFYAGHMLGWKDQLVGMLSQAEGSIREHMEVCAHCHPEISRHLAPLYQEIIAYIPGKQVDERRMDEIAQRFRNWAMEQVNTMQRSGDARNPSEHESFKLHLHNAIVCHVRAKLTLGQLGVASQGIRALGSFKPLIWGCVVTVGMALILAILGGVGVISGRLTLPALAIPFWLFLVGVFALAKDTTAVLDIMSLPELAYDEAVNQLSEQRLSTCEGADCGNDRNE
jgi:hypothetical protein